jgi:phospholipid/cholesterol/gamma-HCH transport system substrate-binding protein
VKRTAAIILSLAAAVAAASSIGGCGGGGSYLVRAVFDNGGFVVNGEDVRIAGARVGSVDSVGVAMPNETVSYQGGHPHADPGKAVIVLKITDPGFQDFRADASCMIRQQALIGEKYIDCRPTLPRAPGSPPPPPLRKVPDGQPGAGQYLLPVEQNGESVDPDLVTDMFRRPYAERLRLLLNGLGAGFAARGQDLAEIVRRADPALRDTDRVLAILANQRNQLARLADDSARVLGPLARQRAHVGGFIDNAGATAEATAERGADLQASLHRLPALLIELRTTMGNLHGFATGAEPVFADFNRSAGALSVATKRLTPFLGNSTTALRRLGSAGLAVGPDLGASQPVLQQVKRLGDTGSRPLQNGSALLTSFQQHKGMENLMDLIYNTNASVNGFDSYGHFLRTLAVPTNCVDYSVQRFTGCNANFRGGGTKKKKKKKKKGKASAAASVPQLIPQLSPGVGAPPASPQSPPDSGAGGAQHTATTPDGLPRILDYLLGP